MILFVKDRILAHFIDNTNTLRKEERKMKVNMKPVGLILLITLITALFVLAGCGGGGGSGSSSSENAPADTGTVALSLTDGPTDDYKHIYLYITQVSLLPANGGDPVVIFKSKDPDGYRVDLLDLQGNTETFIVARISAEPKQ